MDTKAFVQDSISRSLDKYLELHPNGGGAAIQVSTLPEASAEEEGKIYQFIGATTAEYTNGYFYECVEILPATDPKTYQWVQKDVQPGGASGDYQAGQGIRIQNAVIDTPLLDEDYEKEIIQVPGLVPGEEEQIFPIRNVSGSSPYSYFCHPGTTNGISPSDWGMYFSREALTRDNAILYIKTDEDNDWHMVTGYVHVDERNWSWEYPTYDLRPTRSHEDGGPRFNTYSGDIRPEEGMTGAKRILSVQVPGMVDEPVYIHQVSGTVKEDYYDEWFTDLTEQDVHQGVEQAFSQGAVTIQEQYAVGEEVLIGTWKENNVVYDLFRKVVDFGTLPNNAEKTVQHGVTNIVRFVKVYGIGSNGQLSGNLPYIDTYGYIRLSADSTSITVSTNSDRSAWTALAIIKFIRIRG